MKKIHLTVCVTLVAAPLLVHAGKPDEIEIDSRFIACPTNDVAVASTLIGTNKVTGIKLDPGALPAGFKILSSPTVITLLGQPAEIQVTENPSQYFVKQSDGCFQLRQMRPEDGAGAALTIRTAAGDSDKTVKLNAKVKFSSILKREELPDVALEVGKPIIETIVQNIDVEMKLGAWLVSRLPDSAFRDSNNPDRAILLMLRIRRVDATGVPIDAHGQPLAR